MGQNRNFQGPHLCKWSVQLFRMTKNMRPPCLRDLNALFHRNISECGDARVGNQMDVTLKCFRDQWPELPFSGRSFWVIEMGINDVRWLSLYLKSVPSGHQLTGTWLWRPGEGGFVHLSDTWSTWCNTDSWEEIPSLHLFEMCRCEEDPRLISLSWAEFPSYWVWWVWVSECFLGAKCERRRNIDGVLWPNKVDILG